MSCTPNKPYYIPQNNYGIKLVNSLGTGQDVEIYWYQAFPDVSTYKIAYNIYFSSEEATVFTEGPKYVSTNPCLVAKISDFTPGQTYYFCVRATEYDPLWYNLNFLADGYSIDGYDLKAYPETLLAADISATDTVIPITDINLFPPYGIIRIGNEYIKYDSKDIPDSTLLVSERGFLGTTITEHLADGYNGDQFLDPIITFFPGLEETNKFISPEEVRFNYPNFPFTVADGYRQITEDLLTTDLTVSDANAVGFPSYPYNDWVRGDLDILFKGGCLDSYIGVTTNCADGYGGVGLQVKNTSIADINDQRQELLLSFTGEPVVLMKRLWTGISCSCVESNKNSPEARCPFCYGTGFITGFDQYFNPRRSDSKIMVRFGPYTDDLRQDDAGLESIGNMDCWTLTVPSLHDRDIIQRFNIDGTPDYLYEVLDVTRNQLLYGVAGNQHFKAVRIRKTEAVYSWKKFNDTSAMPVSIQTTVGLLKSSNGSFLPHTHSFVISENILSISQINQTTGISAGHNHQVTAGQIQPSPIDGHTHQILF
jgi:hypothetical protein